MLKELIENNMIYYPGDPEPELSKYITLEEDGCQGMKLNIGTHTGTHMDAPAHFVKNGKTIDKGIKYFDKIGVAEFEMESGNLKVGDEILITGPTTGAVMQTIEEIRVDLKPVDETVKGERFSLKVNEKIRPSDRLYKMEKVQLEKVFE